LELFAGFSVRLTVKDRIIAYSLFNSKQQEEKRKKNSGYIIPIPVAKSKRFI
jgi:hypothetical protein